MGEEFLDESVRKSSAGGQGFMAGIKEAVALDMMGDKISQRDTVMKNSTEKQNFIDQIESMMINLEHLKYEN